MLLSFFLFLTALSAATVDGIEIHSTSTGKGPRTVILVHGWTCDETSWEAQVPVLSKDYRVITLDLPGHGKSGTTKDGKLSMDLFARAVESVRSESKADRVVLVGHSMGTPVVVQYARLYPQHVAAMVFVDGPVTPRARGRNAAPSNAPPGQVMAGPEGAKRRESLVRGMVSRSTPEVQKHVLSMMMATSETTAVEAMNATEDPAVWKDDVFTQPVLGLYTVKSSAGNPEYMKTHFPNTDYNEVAGAGHFVMLDKPDEFNRLLLEFLGKQKF